MARLHTAEACAHAIAVDARSCTAALRLAEDATARIGRTEQPAWAGYFTPAHLAGTAIRCLRDLGRTKEALGHTEQALHLTEGSVRTRALHTALIASIYAAWIRASMACATWSCFRESDPGIRCPRAMTSSLMRAPKDRDLQGDRRRSLFAPHPSAPKIPFAGPWCSYGARLSKSGSVRKIAVANRR